MGRSLGSLGRSRQGLSSHPFGSMVGGIASSSSSLRRLIIGTQAGGPNVCLVLGFLPKGPGVASSGVLFSRVGDFSMLHTMELLGAGAFLCGDCEAARNRALDSFNDFPSAGLEIAALSEACQLRFCHRRSIQTITRLRRPLPKGPTILKIHTATNDLSIAVGT